MLSGLVCKSSCRKEEAVVMTRGFGPDGLPEETVSKSKWRGSAASLSAHLGDFIFVN